MVVYRGNCHCGDFVYELDTPHDITEGRICDCSICYKKGYIHHSIRSDADGKFTVVKGSVDNLTSYTFGTGTFHHKFCPKCGSPVFINGMGITAVNLRCLQKCSDSSFIPSLKKIPFDGKALQPARVPPAYTGPEPTGGPQGDEPAKTYHGGCHCGAVRLALRIKPFELWDIKKPEDRIIDCNCSVCMRGGYVWVYPKKEQSVIQGRENLSEYRFNHYANYKAFCRTCGVHIFNGPGSFTPEEEAKLPPLAQSQDAKDWRARVADILPINLRVLDDVDIDDLPVQVLDLYTTRDPQYVMP